MPGPRYDDWTHVHVNGDRALAAPYLPYARKMLGYVQEQRASNGVQTQELNRVLKDGTRITASFAGNIPRIEITPANPKAPMEEVIYLYVSATDGLRIYDLGTRTLVKHVTGLGAYLLHDVNAAGNVAWLAYDLGVSTASMARVDITALSAFGVTYTVKTPAPDEDDPPIDGVASESNDATLSPDEKVLLMHFGGSATTGGILQEGVGGVLVLDPTTLLMRRPPIRMTFEPAPLAWAPDSSRFYVGCSRNDDVGDLPATARLQDLTESTNDYVAVFDADGVLLGSRQLATWLDPPGAGFSRMVKGIVASNERVYVSVDGVIGFTGDLPTLYVLDATDSTLPVVTSLSLSSITTIEAPPNLCLSRDGKTLTLSYPERVVELDVAGDALAIRYVAEHAQLHTWAPGREPAYDELQLGPLSRFGGQPDNRRFFYNIDTDVNVVRAYATFELGGDGDPSKRYELDLRAVSPDVTFKRTYRLASVGLRAQRMPA